MRSGNLSCSPLSALDHQCRDGPRPTAAGNSNFSSSVEHFGFYVKYLVGVFVLFCFCFVVVVFVFFIMAT